MCLFFSPMWDLKKQVVITHCANTTNNGLKKTQFCTWTLQTSRQKTDATLFCFNGQVTKESVLRTKLDVRTKAPKPFLLVKTNEVSEFWLQPLSTLRVQKNFFCKSYLNTITSVYTIAEFFGSIVQQITIRI